MMMHNSHKILQTVDKKCGLLRNKDFVNELDVHHYYNDHVHNNKDENNHIHNDHIYNSVGDNNSVENNDNIHNSIDDNNPANDNDYIHNFVDDYNNERTNHHHHHNYNHNRTSNFDNRAHVYDNNHTKDEPDNNNNYYTTTVPPTIQLTTILTIGAASVTDDAKRELDKTTASGGGAQGGGGGGGGNSSGGTDKKPTPPTVSRSVRVDFTSDTTSLVSDISISTFKSGGKFKSSASGGHDAGSDQTDKPRGQTAAMGNTNGKQEKIGNSPYTRSGVSPPKVANKSGSDAPTHRIYDPMTLELHMADERVRARGLSPAEREWRHKYLQDQNLHPDEPIHVDAVHRQLNPVRMLYRWPMDKLFLHFLEPTFGTVYGTGLRVGIPKVLMGFLFVEFIYYIYKYEDKDWQRTRGLGTFANNEFVERRQEIGQKYPGIFELATSDPAKYDHYHPSFKKRLAMVDVGETQRSW